VAIPAPQKVGTQTKPEFPGQITILVVMRLPFSNRRTQDEGESDRRSSLSEEHEAGALETDGEESSAKGGSVREDSSATSYSSYSSFMDNEKRQSQMYELSGISSGTERG
jgi:hypothetical protein